METTTEDENANEEFILEKIGFEIKIKKLQNMIPSKSVVIGVDIDGSNVVSFKPVVVDSTEVQLDMTTFYEVTDVSEHTMYKLTSHPIVFLLMYEDLVILDVNSATDNEKTNKKKWSQIKKSSSASPSKKGKRSTDISVSNKSDKKSDKSKISKKNKSQENLKSSDSLKILGMANMDFISLLLGQDKTEEVLLVHQTEEEKGSQAMAWTNLPRIQVEVTGKGGITEQISNHISNVLFFTLESLYNILPVFNENTQVATILPLAQDYEVAKFTNGSLLVDDTTKFISRRKKWNGLSILKGQGSLSSYKLSDNIAGLKHSMDFELTEESLRCYPRIQWNQLQRISLNTESQQIFKNKLMKFRCWPLEIMCEKGLGNLDSKKKKETESSKSFNDATCNHFITFLDLTRLLYPGDTKVRLASQLYTYTKRLVYSCFGSEHNMFNIPEATESNTLKSKSGGSKKTLSPKSAKKGKNTSIEETTEKEPSLVSEPEPVFNADGKPVFIIVEVELLKPLVKKRCPEEIQSRIQEIVPMREPPSRQELETTNVTEEFENCIKNTMHNIHDEYQIFYHRDENSERSSKNFLMHLYKTGAYTRMCETMKATVEAYSRNSMHVENNLGTVNQDVMAEVYKQLIIKMCDIVNFHTSFDFDTYPSPVICDELLYYSAEAMEEGDFDRAQEYLLQRLEKTKQCDPQVWIDYAKFWVRKQEFEKAGDCAREAISLDARHVPALFFHGLLSWLTEDFVVAEIFLAAAAALNPHSSEAWLALHLFHKSMNNQLDATTELLHGKECVKEFLVPLEKKANPLSWCPTIPEVDRIFLHIAIQMINFSFPELAELALSYDLLLYGRTVEFLYYLGVCHYLQERYRECLQHLDEALTMVWEDVNLWTLKGNCFYKLNQFLEAKEALEFAFNLSDDNTDSHLLNLRLGNIYVSERDQEKAHTFYLRACKISPTPLSWLGLGITSFMADKMEDAELALNEANMLDCRLPRVWGYLALVNLMMARPDVYNKCIVQALRYGLDDPVLLERLSILCQYVQPVDVISEC